MLFKSISVPHFNKRVNRYNLVWPKHLDYVSKLQKTFMVRTLDQGPGGLCFGPGCAADQCGGLGHVMSARIQFFT